MRTSTIFLAGLAAGGLGGGLGGWLGHAMLGSSSTRSPSRQTASSNPSGDPRNPGARGRPPAAPPSEETTKTLHTLEGVRSRDPAAGARGLAALAMVQALAGNEEQFFSFAAQALRQGLGIEELLAALSELPADRRGAMLEALLDEVPGAGFERLDVARMLAESGRPERALALVRSVVPKQKNLEPEWARLLLRLDPQGGVALLLQSQADQRWGDEALGYARALLVEAGQEKSLVPFLERTLDARPGDHNALRWLREVDPAAAQARVAALMKADPDDPWAWAFLGEMRRDAGDAAGAFEAFRKAAERKPSLRTFRDLVRADPAKGLDLVVGWAKDSGDDEILGALGESYLLAGRKEDAAQAFVRAHEHDPGDEQWIDRLVELNPALAVTITARDLGANPSAASSDALGRYGAALAAAGRKEEAFDQYLAAHRKSPDAGEWQRALVDVDPPRALPYLEAQVRDNPADTSAQGAYGMALAAVGRTADAATALERAVDRGEAERWYPALARLDADRAIVALDRRARLEALDDDLWGLLGRELHARNRDAEARAAYERAAAIDPANRTWTAALSTLP